MIRSRLDQWFRDAFRNLTGVDSEGRISAILGQEDEQEDTGLMPTQPTLSRFKSVENTNYAIDLAKQSGMHIVGIQGADIVDAKRTLVLGLVWQIMR